MKRDIPFEELKRLVFEDFTKQGVMQAMQARITKFELGEAHIEFPLLDTFKQQHGALNAGIVTTAIDTACGLAAGTYGYVDVVTVEFKTNFVASARAENFKAIGKVIKSGKTLSICTGSLTGIVDGKEKTFAIMQATMMGLG